MKQLKPGQLCTIKGHVFRCKKATTEYVCSECRKANKTGTCILEQVNTFIGSQYMCLNIFELRGYPVLVK